MMSDDHQQNRVVSAPQGQELTLETDVFFNWLELGKWSGIEGIHL